MIACHRDGRWFETAGRGVFVVEAIRRRGNLIGRNAWAADRLICPQCGTVIFANFSKEPFASDEAEVAWLIHHWENRGIKFYTVATTYRT